MLRVPFRAARNAVSGLHPASSRTLETHSMVSAFQDVSGSNAWYVGRARKTLWICPKRCLELGSGQFARLFHAGFSFRVDQRGYDLAYNRR